MNVQSSFGTRTIQYHSTDGQYAREKKERGGESHRYFKFRYKSVRAISSNTTSDSRVDSANTNGKPISAIAAARLKAAAATQVPIIEDTGDVPQSPLVDAAESDFGESEPEETTPPVDRNFNLCTWRKNAETTLSDTDEELTIILEKHATVAFVGSYEVKVLRGAINVNGANIGAVLRGEETLLEQRVFVPSTHPITKIRGLDRTNHVQFLHCQEPTPLATMSPLFAGIWSASSEAGKERSFQLVRSHEQF